MSQPIDILRVESFRQEAAIDLAVVVPTFNERENIPLLIDLLKEVLAGIEWEIIFVDDSSPDGTADVVRKFALTDRRIRILQRVGRQGLSSACIEGMLATPAAHIAVMDADLQHDESILPQMLSRMKADHLDIVVASRNVTGGSMGDFQAKRVWLSNLGNRISRLVCKCDVTDPMSGFFLVDGSYFRLVARRLSGKGFKILVDLLASSPRPLRIGEVGYRFRTRQRGESKLDVNVEFEYLSLILDKIIGRAIPTRFILFSLVGTLGLAAHLTTLGLLFRYGKVSFVVAQGVATAVAIILNYFLNNVITFRDRRLRGSRLLLGLLIFAAACSVGALANLAFSRALYGAHFPWYVAGTAGIAVSSVWNYGVNTVLTWRRAR
jgi:dolichol-phosphate mannosyltransferase